MHDSRQTADLQNHAIPQPAVDVIVADQSVVSKSDEIGADRQAAGVAESPVGNRAIDKQ